MPKLKSFCKLSRRQQIRRLKQMQNRECFLMENINDLNQVNVNSSFDKEDSNIVLLELSLTILIYQLMKTFIIFLLLQINQI